MLIIEWQTADKYHSGKMRRIINFVWKILSYISRDTVCECKMGWEHGDCYTFDGRNDAYHYCTCNPKLQMKIIGQVPQHWNCKPCQIARKKEEYKKFGYVPERVLECEYCMP